MKFKFQVALDAMGGHICVSMFFVPILILMCSYSIFDTWIANNMITIPTISNLYVYIYTLVFNSNS